MTIQIPDVLMLDGRRHTITASPLLPWLEAHPDIAHTLEAPDSSVARGFVATWAVQDGWLMLTHLDAHVRRGADGHTIGLRDIMGVQAESLRAEWFSGELVAQRARRSRTLRFSRGRLVG